jgi:membrane-bound lytic murein transglycosylase MltF
MEGDGSEMKTIWLLPLLIILVSPLACQESVTPSLSARQEASPEEHSTQEQGDVHPPSEEPVQSVDDALLERLYQLRYKGDLDELVERRIIRMLVVSSPMFYFLDGARQRGVTYEGAKEFEKYLNRKLRTGQFPVHIVLMPVRRRELIAGLVEGRGDISAANLTVTPERSKLVDFTRPVYPNVSEIIVTGPSAPKLESIDDLAGREVHVRASSSYYASLVRLNQTFRKSGKPDIVLVPADENLEDEEILEMVNADLIQISVIDSHKADFWQDIFDKIKVHLELAVNSGGNIAWALRKESPKLRKLLDEFIARHAKGTLFGNMMLKRYLRDNKWIRNPLAQQEHKKFLRVVDIFKKYGDQYDIPHLLVTAQAYQESHLNQNLRSSAGAVGVMQIRPETAAGSPINIPRIEELENNVHAGVKYLRFVTDTYFKDESITEMDKTLLALASYNAGPNRIARLRKKAAARGLDPNRWFQSVELVAPRQTVQYVSNIYRYYLAYKTLPTKEE